MSDDWDLAGLRARRVGDAAATALARRFGEALRVGDPAAANAVIDAAVEVGFAGTEVQSRVIAPAMRWIGTLWEQGVSSVADEHLATALSYQSLTRLYPGLLRGSARSDRPVVVAAVHGEHHVLGLRMAADALEGAGWDVRFLGADVPAVSLYAWISEHDPVLVALGVTMSLGTSALAGQLQAIHDFDQDIRLVVGGQGVPPVLRNIPGLFYVSDTERLVGAVEDALKSSWPLELPPGIGAGGVVRGGFSSGGFSTTEGVDTVEARLAGVTAAATDQTREQARRAFTLEQLAFRDPLTALWNRRAFDDRYEQFSANPADGLPALLMIDVDRFKTINDGFGHDAGDQVLIDVARCINETVRPGDFAARYGGDEFAVLLPNTAAGDAVMLGERIRKLIETELTQPAVSISVGVTVAGGFDKRRATLDVDQALYQAKQRGRNRVALTQ